MDKPDEKGIRLQKRIAMGDKDALNMGNFGVQDMAEHSSGAHPDMARATHRKTNRDGDRAARHPIDRGEGSHPAQAAPDHGPH